MILNLEKVNFSFTPSKIILDNLSMQLEQGKIYALMGANGSGKTTLFNIITGFIDLQSGSIHFNNKNITKLNPFKRNLLGISRTFQDLRLITNLSVTENIDLAYKNNLSDKWYNTIYPSKKLNIQQIEFSDRTRAILEQFHLSEVQTQLAGEISYGQQKLLTIACCVANNAQILLLDEPIAGINPVYREQLTTILKRLKQQGKTILLIEHNTDFIADVSDKIYFLKDGNFSIFENMETLRNDKHVMEAYT